MMIALIETGCFNPPTNMHLRLLKTAKYSLEQAGHSVKVGQSVLCTINMVRGV